MPQHNNPMTQEEIDEAFRKAGGIPKPQPIEIRRGRGAPTDYKPEYCEELIKFFTVQSYREIPETWYNPDGSVKRESFKLVANPPPHIGQFARSIGVAKSTVYDWARKYPDFGYSLVHAHDIRRAMIIDNALAGLYNPLFAKLAAANMFGWHDRQDVNHTGEVKSVIVRYHKPEREAIPDTLNPKTGLIPGGEDQEKTAEGRPIKVLAESLATPPVLSIAAPVLQDPKGLK